MSDKFVMCKAYFELLDPNTPPEKENVIHAPIRQHIWRFIKAGELSDQFYGITLTFNPIKLQQHGLLNKDDSYIMGYIVTKMNNSRVINGYSYVLYPEYTRKCILHFHGLVKADTQYDMSRFSKWWNRMFGYSKVELTIRVYWNWIFYMIKDREIVGLYPIVCLEDKYVNTNTTDQT